MDINKLVETTKKYNVLYIEDDVHVQQDTKSIFESLFFSIDIANDGLEGLEKYKDYYNKRKNYYDLVISDINMPNMDGIIMSEKILELNNKQLILILSAYNDSDKLVKLIDIGISNFIHKPIELNLLVDILSKISKSITESKTFEKNIDEIKRLNEEYNNTIKNYDKFVIAARTDLLGNFVDISEAYEIISGYKKEELIGKSANILRHKNTSDKVYYEMWSDIQNGKIWAGEIQNKKKNGDPYWISSVVYPYMDKNHNVIGYNAISEDITKQKEIEQLSSKLQIKNEKIKDLLDNTEQGFLSCSKDMLIEKDYSLKCEELLEVDLENKDISTLLFSNDATKKETFRFGFNLLVNENNISNKEDILSLMPKEHNINNIVLKIEYKILADQRIMLILTNITKNKKLKNQLENERVIYRMIIAVIVNSNQFWEIKEDYCKFIKSLESEQIDLNFKESKLPKILYKLHTFKGLFSQKELIYTPEAIHEFEDVLHKISYNNISEKSINEIILTNKLKESLNKDIFLITNILGEEFLDQNSYLKINITSLESIENKIKSMIYDHNINENSLNGLLDDISSLRNHHLVDILNAYAKQVHLLAKKLSKKIHRIKIHCDKDILVDKHISGFVRSLVHIFRNTIVHGIEMPETRTLNKKSKYGNISCNVIKKENMLIIKIKDDGVGLDFDLIKDKAVEIGYTQDNEDDSQNEKLINFIFNNNLSTYDDKNEFAGCGVGLSAVNEELKKINGTYKVKSKPNKGVKLIFKIPMKKDL